MIRNYIKVAFRNIVRNKAFSFINIFGLSLSISVCMIIIMMIADQMNYDSHNTNKNRIYRINTERLNDPGWANGFATSPLPLAAELRENYTGIEKSVRIRRGFGNSWVGLKEDVNIPLGGFFVDPGFLAMFQYELEYGDPATALSEPNCVVITKKAAQKLYDIDNPVGEVIKVGNLGEYKVTGVLKEANHKSHILFEALASMSSVKSLEADSTFEESIESWANTTMGWVYVLLEENKSKQQVEQYLAEIDDKQYTSERANYRFYLQGLTEINPGPLLSNTIGPGMPYIIIYVLGGLALIIVLSACFNYTNLSIAKSISRAREVGIRKVSGAFRHQLFAQFIVEAIIIALGALGLSFILLIFLKPAFESLSFAQVLQWELNSHPYVIGITILFTIIIGALAGMFPAVVLSGFQPIQVLKDIGRMRLFSKIGIRKALLVVQFSVSLFFIITVTLVYKQVKMMIAADYGYETKSIITIPSDFTNILPLKNEFAKQSGVMSVSCVSHIPASGRNYGNTLKRNLTDENTGINYFSVDENYLDNMGISLIAGRNLDPQLNSHGEKEVLINEEASRFFGFGNIHDALGQTLYNEDSVALEIVGIIPNYNHEVMMAKIAPLALRFIPDMYNYVQVRVSQPHSPEIHEQITSAWSTVNPDKKMSYKYMNDEISGFYDMMFGDLIKIITVFCALALCIASLGLLGMAIYTTESRLKEVSIRKVLGASDKSLVMLLSNGFIKLLVIAAALAIPTAYFANNLWLQSMATRTSISLGVIAFGSLIMIIIGALTIGSQTIRAAYTNPADRLRSE